MLLATNCVDFSIFQQLKIKITVRTSNLYFERYLLICTYIIYDRHFLNLDDTKPAYPIIRLSSNNINLIHECYDCYEGLKSFEAQFLLVS